MTVMEDQAAQRQILQYTSERDRAFESRDVGEATILQARSRLRSNNEWLILTPC